MSFTAATKEAIWLRRILLGICYQQITSTTRFEDNQGCMAIAQNPMHHGRNKHIDVRYHFLLEQLRSRNIIMQYCRSNNMLADGLTKLLLLPKSQNFTGSLRLDLV